MRTISFTIALFTLILFESSGPKFDGLETEDFSVSENLDERFRKYELITNKAERQTVMAGFILDRPTAELVVLEVEEVGSTSARIYSLENGEWGIANKLTLGAPVFVDLVNIDGQDRLLSYESGSLLWFDIVSGSMNEIARLSSSFLPPRKDEIPHLDISRDINADGFDDLLIPDFDGFWVLVQKTNGEFADPVKVGNESDLTRITGADGYRYDSWSQSRVHEFDYNKDGRVDLVYWKEDHFAVHLQNEQGLFDQVSTTFTTQLPFDSDNLNWLDSHEMKGRILDSIADMNDDGIADMVLYTLEGETESGKRSAYRVYFASIENGVTVFASEEGDVFETSDHIQLSMDRLDFEGDGDIDLILTTMHVKYLSASLWKKLKGSMGDDIWLELEFYEMEDGRFPDQPNFTKKVALDGPPSHTEPLWIPLVQAINGGKHKNRSSKDLYPRAFNMVAMLGDVTGDDHLDLLIESTHRGLDLSYGGLSAEIFTRKSKDISVSVPSDEEYVWMFDMNKDGKQDIIMHHPFSERDVHGGRKQGSGEEPHRVVVLMSL